MRAPPRWVPASHEIGSPPNPARAAPQRRPNLQGSSRAVRERRISAPRSAPTPAPHRPCPLGSRSLLNRLYNASDASPRRVPSPTRTAPLVTPVKGVPVYVMLPLDTVWLLERDGTQRPTLIREKAMDVGLEMLRRAGVEGVMIDVW